MSGYNQKLIVAAIDFGTTFSAYAYSTNTDYERKPDTIYANKHWKDGCALETLKTPTVVLFDQNERFHAFGYEAEKKYAKLSEDNEHIGWRYFRRFKMELHGKKKLNRKRTLTDDQGNRMPAIKVFTAAIKYLKDHLLMRVNESIPGTEAEDISWVLTVPAIWEDSAKQFMQEAANDAGIPDNQLMLALEPEAAAIYCKEKIVSKAKQLDVQPSLETFDTGAQFIVLDLGGGTVDITVHEVENDGTLAELYPPSGGPWGGTLVDKCILQQFTDLFGKETFQQFKNECQEDFLELQRTLELKKRNCTPSEDNVTVALPSVLYGIFSETAGETFDVSLQKSLYAKTVAKKREKLQFNSCVFKGCFEESVANLIEHVKGLLRKPKLQAVKSIIMVGGFADSEILKQAVTTEFAGRATVILPEQPEIAVVSGAVMYGHQTNSISSRILRHTYGVSTAVPFDENLNHPELNKTFTDGRWMCSDVFKILIKRGTRVIPGSTKITETFNTHSRGSRCVCVDICSSSSKYPTYANIDGSRIIGKLVLSLEEIKWEEKQKIDVTMWFGDTTLYVEAKEHATDNKVEAKFNFLA